MANIQADVTTIENETLPQNLTSHLKSDACMVGLELFLVPVIAVFGITGNAFSLALFSTKPLNEHTSSFLLGCRSLSDIGFLSVLLFVWASGVFNLHLSQIDLVCQTVVYLTYVFSCLSAWLVVLFALENCIMLTTPFSAKKICKIGNAKGITSCMTIAIVLCYSFPFWTVGRNCVPKDNYQGLVTRLVYVDSALTMFVPFAIMTFALIGMLISFIKSCERRRRRTFSSTTSKNPIRHAIIMIFMSTLTFVLLTLPSNVSRIRLLYFLKMDGAQIFGTKPVFQAISELTYYLSLAINFVIYYAFGRRFRASFNENVLRKRTRRHNNTARRTNCISHAFLRETTSV
ncbi:hypothetical protein DPMN_100240 [Dreissena polymorpha]|uniref:G-protein coupled receptors family 1 profile domain-containing protein n=2 Tax=Dreissena polymorpha TaxID=45954 RepID=A0A9D4LGY9_DREPO|nr:hypothetical protein DPMN_100240 [Dreissena polymorpha]